MREVMWGACACVQLKGACVPAGGAFNGAMLDAIFAQPKRVADTVGVPHPKVASLRDVPGAPRSIIPALARAGIPVLSIGVNSYAPRPQLPTPCIWKEPATNTSVVLVMTEQGQGYPGNVGPSPTNPGGLAAADCVSHPASAAVLCFAFRTDNSGPPTSVEEVRDCAPALALLGVRGRDSALLRVCVHGGCFPRV